VNFFTPTFTEFLPSDDLMPKPTEACLPGLFTPRQHPIADTSLAAYAHILPTLTERERVVLLALCDAAAPLTGGELAEVLRLPVTSVRPRLTALEDQGLIRKLTARLSEAKGESFAHPYAAVVTRAAVEGAR
jgi:hypothetical protein